MKKLLLFFAALLPCSLALSQEAEENGRYAEFQLIPRTDFNGFFSPGKSGDGSSGFNFGNTSLYTLIEGAFSEHVSFTLNNHWVSFPYAGLDETAGLYRNTLYSNTNNWLDIAKFDFTFGNWTFTVGKDCLATGGFEYDAWDVDTDYLMTAGDKILLASNLWYDLPAYQWGAKVAYNFFDHTLVGLQMTTSPFGERPFASGLYAYSLKVDGNYGIVSSMVSTSALGRPDGGYSWLFAVSEQVNLGDFTLGFDWYNTPDVAYDDDDAPCGLEEGNTMRFSLAYAPSEKYDVKLVSNWYVVPDVKDDINIGAIFHYYPMDNLELHTALGWDWFTGTFSAMAGLKYNLTFLSL